MPGPRDHGFGASAMQARVCGLQEMRAEILPDCDGGATARRAQKAVAGLWGAEFQRVRTQGRAVVGACLGGSGRSRYIGIARKPVWPRYAAIARRASRCCGRRHTGPAKRGPPRTRRAGASPANCSVANPAVLGEEGAETAMPVT